MGKTAIFGGTFNPVHNGHVEIVKALLKLDYIDKIIIIPTYMPPHKHAANLASGEDRLVMCKLAFSGFERVSVSDVELVREGLSYTYDTVMQIKSEERCEVCVVCGGDMAATLPTWHRYKELISEASFLAFTRAGTDDSALLETVDIVRKDGGEVTVISDRITDVSSTGIRSGDLCGLPSAVAQYIKEKGLYGDMNSKIDEYKELLSKRLTAKRYEHSLCVADEAKRLAVRYGGDQDKCYLAGLLHDITKNAEDSEHLKLFTDFGIILSDIEFSAKKLWHAMSGELYVKHILGIDDSELCDAIRYHTTARAGMTLTDKILYLADFTSADRDYDDVDIMRRLVDVGLDDALRYALSYSIKELVNSCRPVHTDTVAAYNEVSLRFQQTKRSN